MNKLLIFLLIGLLTVSVFAEGDTQPTATAQETTETKEEIKEHQTTPQDETKETEQQGQNHQEQKQDHQDQQHTQDQEHQKQQEDQQKQEQKQQEEQQQQQQEKEKQQKQQEQEKKQNQQNQNFEQQQDQQPQQENQNQNQNEEPQQEQKEVVIDDEDRGAIMSEWETHMQDFIPDEMLTFEVNPKTEELFMEDIDQPTLIRGAFFVSYFSDEKIDFTIRDPTKKRIFHKVNKREGIFSLNVTDKGQYEFLFSNIKGKDKKSVTFALDVHNVTETHLSHHDLNPVEKKLEHVASGIKDYLNEQRFASKRQISQLESIQSAHKRLLVFSVFEILIVIIATAWQVYYIKKILDNKVIV